MCSNASEPPVDQAVWWLASQSHADPEWTQFPIFGENNVKTRRRFADDAKGIPSRAVAFIESFQPYNRPCGTPLASDPLWQLNEIGRIDKHRRISVRTTAAQIDTHLVATVTPIENGCELVVPCNAEPALEPIFTPTVVFGNNGVTIDIDGIERICNLVAHVLG
jgi:hypothetical protein